MRWEYGWYTPPHNFAYISYFVIILLNSRAVHTIAKSHTVVAWRNIQKKKNNSGNNTAYDYYDIFCVPIFGYYLFAGIICWMIVLLLKLKQCSVLKLANHAETIQRYSPHIRRNLWSATSAPQEALISVDRNLMEKDNMIPKPYIHM